MIYHEHICAENGIPTIFKEPKLFKLAIHNQTVNQVMSFQYLAPNNISNRNIKEEVKNQITKATLIAGFLEHVVCTNKLMSIKSTIRVI